MNSTKSDEIEPEFDVFISYNREDIEVARQLATILSDNKIKLWIDLNEIKGGDAWLTNIEDGMKKSRSIAILHGSSGTGPFQSLEIQVALALKVSQKARLIPVLMPEFRRSGTISHFVKIYNWVDLSSGLTPSGISKLIASIPTKRPIEKVKHVPVIASGFKAFIALSFECMFRTGTFLDKLRTVAEEKLPFFVLQIYFSASLLIITAAASARFLLYQVVGLQLGSSSVSLLPPGVRDMEWILIGLVRGLSYSLMAGLVAWYGKGIRRACATGLAVATTASFAEAVVVGAANGSCKGILMGFCYGPAIAVGSNLLLYGKSVKSLFVTGFVIEAALGLYQWTAKGGSQGMASTCIGFLSFCVSISILRATDDQKSPKT